MITRREAFQESTLSNPGAPIQARQRVADLIRHGERTAVQCSTCHTLVTRTAGKPAVCPVCIRPFDKGADITLDDVPDAPFYVVTRDTFLSGWGGAKGRANVVVVPCETQGVADTVKAYVLSRSDMSSVSVVDRFDLAAYVQGFDPAPKLSVINRTTGPRWYQGP